MIENLVIVESPAKGKTIEKFLGKAYVVKSSYGHIRDLAKKNLGIDVENNFQPAYTVPSDKKKVVAELKKDVKNAKKVWLASDEDREGEAIAWHLCEELGLKPEEAQRIVFHEITKNAIQDAIENPRPVNVDLVNAQQARRVLDRLVGFELSPILWKKVKPSLSAGRVQSVAVRLLVEREREVINFKESFTYKVTALFYPSGGNQSEVIKADLSKGFAKREEAYAFLESCKDADFTVKNVQVKPSKKSPAPPFTTSTLQQEASRKLGFSVAQTMSVAQGLYESGKITYMRTDSVNLSKLAISTAKQEILNEFGEKYLKVRNFNTKTKGAQEAHEAIRPTFIGNREIDGPAAQQKLYELIWKRTIATQMTEASFEKTNVTIAVSNAEKEFVAVGEVLKFDGFLKVYMESTDDDTEESTKGLLPAVKIDDELKALEITASQKFSLKPPRYTEASLVKKLEDLGIGRPSTYAPTISTIQARGYVVKEDRKGYQRTIDSLVLKDVEIKEKQSKENTGYEKSKLFPTDIGIVVTDFLVEHFERILDYNFTATVEEEFDEIASGKLIWNKMIEKFYSQFHQKVEKALESSTRSKGERILGDDPVSGKPISVKIGRYGPIAQIGSVEDEEKPKFASLRKGQHLETISLEEALELFKLPRDIGVYEDEEVVASIGRFGPYLRHKSKFYSLNKNTDDPHTVELDRAIEIIEEKREKDKKSVLKTFEEEPELRVLQGRYGPYISYKKKNYRIPKSKNPEELTLDECKELIESGNNKTGKSKVSRKKK